MDGAWVPGTGLIIITTSGAKRCMINWRNAEHYGASVSEIADCKAAMIKQASIILLNKQRRQGETVH